MKKRVLIVEDSSVMRGLLALAVSRYSEIEVFEATDGVAALQMIHSAKEPFDLIFLDLNMPVMDGIKLLGFLQSGSLAGRTVVAVVTTEDSEETEARARSLGAQHFLRKPVTKMQLERVVNSVLEDGPSEPA